VLLLQPALGFLVLAPAMTMLVRRRWPAAAVGAWVFGVVLAAGWYVAVGADTDRADATGTAGDPWAGRPWFAAACLACGLALRLAAGSRRSRPGWAPPPS
jgi:hypothetical protein